MEKQVKQQLEVNATTNTTKTYDRNEIFKSTLDYFNGDELATNTWINKYALKDSYGNIYELNPSDMHKRIAKEIHRIEQKYPNPLSYDLIYELLKNFKYLIPGGGSLTGIGNDCQVSSLSNCFVIGNQYDSYGSIFHIDEQQVQLMKRRGGVGHDLSHIRPDGTPVKNSALTSTGIVPFMERYSNSTREVAQDGRRGALMLSLSIKHPDAEKFINAKLEEGKVTGANISVKIGNDFMKAVINDKPYTQQFPINSEKPLVTKEIDSKRLWGKIIHNVWKSAEPGVLFWDKIVSESPADCYQDVGFQTVSTNPCLPADTWIMTNNGPKQIKSLIGSPFIALVNGSEYYSTNQGFFETGIKELYKITTKSGFVLRGTIDHLVKTLNYKTRKENINKWTRIGDLKGGGNVILNDNTNNFWDGEGNREIGWLLGNFIGDGTRNNNCSKLCYWGDNRFMMKNIAVDYIKRNLKHRSDLGENKTNPDIAIVKSKSLMDLGIKYGISSDKQTIDNKIEQTSSDFYRGFISGIFDADGTVCDNIDKGLTVRLSSSTPIHLELIQRMLSRLGIISKIYYNRRDEGKRLMSDNKGGKKEYNVKASHELSISKNNVKKFYDIVGFNDENKQTKLDLALLKLNKRGLYRERFVDEILSVKPDGIEKVYDCQIQELHEFEANGIIVHNCAEIPLCPYDSCRLLAINLVSYVDEPYTKKASFNFELFKDHVQHAQRIMDDIIDLEIEKIDKIINKVKEDTEPDDIKQTELSLWENVKMMAIKGRRTGLGITSEGDMLAAMGYRYGTGKGLDFAINLQRKLATEAYKYSIMLAKDRGSFEVFDINKEKNNPFLNRVLFENPDMEPEMLKQYTQTGRRNISCLTIAPTGTVSIMTQTTSGIEPAFGIKYTRKRKINPNDKGVNLDNIEYDKQGDAFEKYNVYHHGFIKWAKINNHDINDDNFDELYEISPYYKSTSADIDWASKVKMQGEIQKWVDHSISVTVNLPNDATEEIVSEVYMTAFKSGCKGITAYREGSREGIMVSDKHQQSLESIFKEINVPKRPKILECDVIHFSNKGEKWVGILGMVKDRPIEIFTGKWDSFTIPTTIEKGFTIKVKDNGKSRYDFQYIDADGYKCTMEGLNRAFNREYHNYARLISGVLRQGMPLIYVYELIDDLKLEDGDSITDWKSGVKRLIKRHIKDGVKTKDVCPDCGSNLIFSENCKKCTCGYTACG